MGYSLLTGFKPGDRVKLTERAIRGRAANRKGGKPVNWVTRSGVLKRVTGNKVYARVIWEGRQSVDEVGVRDIELVI
jgi:hypothetical protein